MEKIFMKRFLFYLLVLTIFCLGIAVTLEQGEKLQSSPSANVSLPSPNASDNSLA
jgi:hypothetical protein